MTMTVTTFDTTTDVDDEASNLSLEMGTSVDKALRLLDAFAHDDTLLGVSELARRTGLSKSTAFRLLAILTHHQLIERRGTRYMLGKKLFELGSSVWFCRPRSLRDLALPFLSDLYALSHETVHLAILEGTDVLYLEKLHGHQQVRAPSAVGSRLPAYCSALGKALLAASTGDVVDRVLQGGLEPRTGYTIVNPRLFEDELREIRRSGVAFDREESSVGVNCIAAPIVSRGNRLVGAISICGQTGRFSPQAHASAVKQAARTMGLAVGR